MERRSIDFDEFEAKRVSKTFSLFAQHLFRIRLNFGPVLSRERDK